MGAHAVLCIDECKRGGLECERAPEAAPAARPSPPLAAERPAEPADPADVAAAIPSPFTTAELKAGLPVGMCVRMRRVSADPVVEEVLCVVEADEDGLLIAATAYGADGAPLDPGTELVPEEWSTLERQLTFPAATTTRTAVEVVALGRRWAGWRHVETGHPAGTVRTTEVARDLPGWPVRQVVSRDGAEVLRTELVARGVRQPGAAPP